MGITETQRVDIPTVPLYIVALNRLARLGKASLYTKSKRFVMFNITHPLMAKFVGLRDVERVYLIYKDPEVR